MSFSLRITLFILLITAVAACRGQAEPEETNTDIQITLEMQTDPPVVGNSTLLITLADDSGEAVTDANVAVRGDMNHAGMQPVDTSAQDIDDDGVYEVPFTWTMGGDWILTVTATLPDGTTAIEEFNINGVTSADGEMDMSDMDTDADMDMNENMEDMDTSIESMSEVLVSFDFEPDPPTVGGTTLLITVTDGDGEPINDATINVSGIVPDAEVAPVMGASTSAGEEGVYPVQFDWTTTGNWEITVSVVLADDEVITETFTVEGVTDGVTGES